MAAGHAVLLALALGPVGPAVQTWTGSSPPSGACVGERVVSTTSDPAAIYCCVSSAWTDCTPTGGGGGTPGGSDTQVQFNDASAFGGDAGLVYNKTTDALTVAQIGSYCIWY